MRGLSLKLERLNPSWFLEKSRRFYRTFLGKFVRQRLFLAERERVLNKNINKIKSLLIDLQASSVQSFSQAKALQFSLNGRPKAFEAFA